MYAIIFIFVRIFCGLLSGSLDLKPNDLGFWAIITGSLVYLFSIYAILEAIKNEK